MAETGTGPARAARRIRYTLLPQRAAEVPTPSSAAGMPARFLCLAYGEGADPRHGSGMAALGPEVCVVRSRTGALEATAQAPAPHGLPLAGFSIVEAASVEEVARRVAEMPCARAGGYVEIRPLRDV